MLRFDLNDFFCSLGFFTPRRLPSMDNLSLGGSSIHGEDIPSPSSTYSNTNSLTPTTNEKPVVSHFHYQTIVYSVSLEVRSVDLRASWSTPLLSLLTIY